MRIGRRGVTMRGGVDLYGIVTALVLQADHVLAGWLAGHSSFDRHSPAVNLIRILKSGTRLPWSCAAATSLHACGLIFVDGPMSAVQRQSPRGFPLFGRILSSLAGTQASGLGVPLSAFARGNS